MAHKPRKFHKRSVVLKADSGDADFDFYYHDIRPAGMDS